MAINTHLRVPTDIQLLYMLLNVNLFKNKRNS